MLQATQQSAAALTAMRERAIMATADFYAKIGRVAPQPRPRFYVTAKGAMWHIIDSVSGKTCAFRGTHAKALQVLDGLEAGAASKRGLQ
ncbi:hypothetical protein G7011_00405 [Pseudomonas plecoglossicida]|uniref:hypothetical protein n=1 Tax=Pseudomonas plecoglossicida TaxID=70775 RepID=UPI0015E3C294|nr:hypothetical protein [Pseudomonas plecoglossicida]MBA1195574.1 hypothetical protein [Pseudomonas plecoglossicida]